MMSKVRSMSRSYSRVLDDTNLISRKPGATHSYREGVPLMAKASR